MTILYQFGWRPSSSWYNATKFGVSSEALTLSDTFCLVALRRSFYIFRCQYSFSFFLHLQDTYISMISFGAHPYSR